MLAVKVVVAEELLRLLVSDAAVDEHQPVAHLHEQRAHCPGAEVEFVGGIGWGPELLGNHPKHRAPVQLEIPGVNGVQSHATKVATAPPSSVPLGFDFSTCLTPFLPLTVGTVGTLLLFHLGCPNSA